MSVLWERNGQINCKHTLTPVRKELRVDLFERLLVDHATGTFLRINEKTHKCMCMSLISQQSIRKSRLHVCEPVYIFKASVQHLQLFLVEFRKSLQLLQSLRTVAYYRQLQIIIHPIYTHTEIKNIYNKTCNPSYFIGIWCISYIFNNKTEIN